MLLVVWCLWTAALGAFFVLALAFAEDLEDKRQNSAQESQEEFSEEHD